MGCYCTVPAPSSQASDAPLQPRAHGWAPTPLRVRQERTRPSIHAPVLDINQVFSTSQSSVQKISHRLTMIHPGLENLWLFRRTTKMCNWRRFQRHKRSCCAPPALVTVSAEADVADPPTLMKRGSFELRKLQGQITRVTVKVCSCTAHPSPHTHTHQTVCQARVSFFLVKGRVDIEGLRKQRCCVLLAVCSCLHGLSSYWNGIVKVSPFFRSQHCLFSEQNLQLDETNIVPRLRSTVCVNSVRPEMTVIRTVFDFFRHDDQSTVSRGWDGSPKILWSWLRPRHLMLPAFAEW